MTLTITNCDPATCDEVTCPLHSADRDDLLPLIDDNPDALRIVCAPLIRKGVVRMLQNFVAAYQEKKGEGHAQAG